MNAQDKPYRQAGILLKSSIFFSVSSVIYINRDGIKFDGNWLVIVIVTVLCLVLANFVQAGKRWTKIPVLIMTVATGTLFLYRALYIRDSGEYTALMLSGGSFAFSLWATILIFSPPPEGDDPFKEIILDRDETSL